MTSPSPQQHFASRSSTTYLFEKRIKTPIRSFRLNWRCLKGGGCSYYPVSQLASLKIALPWGMKELFSKGRHKLKSKIVLTVDLLDISMGIFRIY